MCFNYTKNMFFFLSTLFLFSMNIFLWIKLKDKKIKFHSLRTFLKIVKK